MNEHRIHYLYKRYRQRSLSPVELEEFRSVIGSEQFEQYHSVQFDEDWDNVNIQEIEKVSSPLMEYIYTDLSKKIQTTNTRSLIRSLLPYAAVLAIMTTIGIYMWKLNSFEEESFPIALNPGTNQATLTLSNGESIVLSGQQQGIIVGDKLLYTDGTPVATSHSIKYRLDVPLGGQYQITLSDGSEVWLNSGSSLSYPATFNKTERIVELIGEAYFKVTKKSDKSSFLVKTKSETVEVLGTAFNISAYADDLASVTTLISGSVKVVGKTITNQSAASITLVPGEQAIVQQRKISVRQVDVKDFSSWREGMFRFNEERLEDIMKQVARWYKIDVEYRNEDIKNEIFTGNFSRRENAQHIFNGLSYTGSVSFDVEGNKIIIDKKQTNKK